LTTTESNFYPKETNTKRSQIISMDRFSDVRNGWPYDYHNTFWANYNRKYGTQNYEYDFSIEWPFPTGPREEAYLWNHEALLSPSCPSCHRASVQAYKDYPRRATRGVTHYMGLARGMRDLY